MNFNNLYNDILDVILLNLIIPDLYRLSFVNKKLYQFVKKCRKVLTEYKTTISIKNTTHNCLRVLYFYYNNTNMLGKIKRSVKYDHDIIYYKLINELNQVNPYILPKVMRYCICYHNKNRLQELLMVADKLVLSYPGLVKYNDDDNDFWDKVVKDKFYITSIIQIRYTNILPPQIIRAINRNTDLEMLKFVINTYNIKYIDIYKKDLQKILHNKKYIKYISNYLNLTSKRRLDSLISN